MNKRKSIRLGLNDYSQSGVYFLTICTRDWNEFFGHIEGGEVILSEMGKKAREFWLEVPGHYPNMGLDEFVIMPNHIHGIIVVKFAGARSPEPLQKNKYQHIIPKSIGSMIRAYKSALTLWCRENGYQRFGWQRNYYEHIIRDNTDELDRIREYIMNNPLSWSSDRENPYRVGTDELENEVFKIETSPSHKKGSKF